MIVKRNGIFYYRKAIPQSVRAVLGRREFVISLKTRQTTLALQKAHHLDIHINNIIKKAFMGDSGLDFDLSALKGKILKFETETRINEKADGSKTTTVLNKIDPAVILAMKEAGVSSDQIALTIREFLESTGQIAPASPQVESNLNQMRNKTTLREYVTRYIVEKEDINGRPLDSRNKTQLRRLCEIFDDDKTISSFTESDAAIVRNQLAKLPKHSTKYAKLSVAETIKTVALSNPDCQRMNATTIERHFETYQALFKQATESKIYLGKNPFKSVPIVVGGKNGILRDKKRRKNASKEPYSSIELSSMFSTSLFYDFGSEANHENVRFWLPLIGLFTGTRMSQIASLYCEDINYQEGIPVIDFNFNTPDKHGKTDVSFRPVPIHPLLLELGIFEFAKKVNSYNIPSEFGRGTRLFPELRSFTVERTWTDATGNTIQEGTYAKRIEEWFNRKFLVNLGIRKTNDNKSFHAFRATLRGLLEANKVDEHTSNTIIGWAKNEENANTMVRAHYTERTLENMIEALSSIQLPEALLNIPKFPNDLEMNFKRKYSNQWSK